MSPTCMLCYLVWALFLVDKNHALPEEPSHREKLMKVCAKQEITEEITESFEVSSLSECAVSCVNEKSCQSANLCSNGGSKTCTLSRKFPWTCDGNTANDNCKFIYSEIPCSNGGTANETGQYCTCTDMYTGDVCERLYYDCAEPGAVTSRITWIQRGDNPPFTVRCSSGSKTYFLDVNQADFPPNIFPLNKSFHELKQTFEMTGYINGGLESIHFATSQAYYSLIVFVTDDIDFKIGTSIYSNFTLASESERYRLDYLSVSEGVDGLAAMRGRPFSALGNDPEGCAQLHNVAWWYDVNCSTPMIYNDNQRIFYPDKSNPSSILEFRFMEATLRFEGLK